MAFQNLELENMFKSTCKNIKKQYDPFLHQKIKELYAEDEFGNLQHHSEKRWLEFVEESQNSLTHSSQVLQEAIARHPNLPNDIAKKIIASLNVFGSSLLELCKRDGLDDTIYEKAYKKIMALSPQILDEAFDRKINATMLNKTVEESILKDALKNARSGMLENYAQLHIFSVTNDHCAIEMLLYDVLNIDERIVTEIANNPHLPEEHRNKAFDIGCNWLELTNYTPYMASEIYPNIIIYPFGDKSELLIEDKDKIFVMKKYSESTLKSLLKGNLLSESQRKDFIQRVRFANAKPDTAIGKLFDVELLYEKDQIILKELFNTITIALESKRHFESTLLKNERFHSTSGFKILVDSYIEELFKEGVCDKAIRDNLKDIIKEYPIAVENQCDIVKKTFEYIKENAQLAFYGDRLAETNIEIYGEILTTLITSPHIKKEALDLTLRKSEDANLTLLANITLAARLYGDKATREGIKIYDTLTYDFKSNTFELLYKDINYDMIIDILKTAKTLPTNYKFTNKKEINKLISTAKQLKSCEKPSKLKQEIQNIKNELIELDKRDIVNFYIKSNKIERMYKNVMRDIEKLNPKKTLFSKEKKENTLERNEER